MEKASKSLFTSILLDMAVVLTFAWIWRVALDYCLGTSQSSGEGAQGAAGITGTPAYVPSVASYPTSTVWAKRKDCAEKAVYAS